MGREVTSTQIALLEKVEKLDIDDVVEAVRAQIDRALEVIDMSQDEVETLAPCLKPKDCVQPEFCHPGLPEYSIYDISYLRKGPKQQLIDMGYKDINDIDLDGDDLPLDEKQRLEVQAAQTGEIIIDQEKVNEFLGGLKYPLYFLDYEAANTEQPLYDGFKPLDWVVFQYSLHVVREPGAEAEHYEFVGDGKENPEMEMLEKMRAEIGDDGGSVITWHKQFETSRHREMAKRYPEFDEFLKGLNNRVVDLEDPFKQKMYVDPDFKGRSSLKKVLPAMCPELGYGDFAIGDGLTAMNKWLEIAQGDDEDLRAEVLRNLKEYCHLDTFSMVRILEELEKAVS